MVQQVVVSNKKHLESLNQQDKQPADNENAQAAAAPNVPGAMVPGGITPTNNANRQDFSRLSHTGGNLPNQ